MHLDCVFSTLGSNCCIMLEDIMGEGSPTRRLVDEYERDPATGQYKLSRWVRRGLPRMHVCVVMCGKACVREPACNYVCVCVFRGAVGTSGL